MAWLILLAALACFAMAVLLPVGTGVVLLLSLIHISQGIVR
mgnify:CR=1 FL=1